MQFNRSQLLAKIDEYYVAEAARRAERVGKVQEIWDEWQAVQRDKRPRQLAVMYEMVQDLDKPTMPFSKEEIVEALGDTFYEATPHWQSDIDKRMDKATGKGIWPAARPKDLDEAEILQGLRSGGRFEPLRRMLQTATDDTVSLSALQRLGVMSTEDSRILWGL